MVEGAARRQPGEQRRVAAREAHLVPADVRQLQLAGASSWRTSPATMPEALGAAQLGRGVERELHAEADAEHRRARGRRARAAARRGRARAGAPSRAGRRRRRARTRPAAARSSSWSLLTSRARRRARAPSRPSGGCPCRSRRRRSRPARSSSGAHAVSVPFVLGTPVSVGSIATASRSARANALNAASIMWWALRAGFDAQVQRQLGGVGERAEELLGQLVLEAAGRARRQLGLEQRERAAGDVDRAARARLVHRHGGRAVADDPRAVAERRVERLAEHDRGVLGGVVRAGLQVAADRRRRGRSARGGRAGRACGRGSRRRSRARPRRCLRAPARGARRSRRSCARSWRCGSWLWILAHARLHRLGVHARSPRRGRSARPRRRACRPPAPICTSAIGRRKWRGESVEAKRAAPPVGSTWLEPAT